MKKDNPKYKRPTEHKSKRKKKKRNLRREGSKKLTKQKRKSVL